MHVYVRSHYVCSRILLPQEEQQRVPFLSLEGGESKTSVTQVSHLRTSPSRFFLRTGFTPMLLPRWLPYSYVRPRSSSGYLERVPLAWCFPSPFRQIPEKNKSGGGGRGGDALVLGTGYSRSEYRKREMSSLRGAWATHTAQTQRAKNAPEAPGRVTVPGRATKNNKTVSSVGPGGDKM